MTSNLQCLLSGTHPFTDRGSDLFPEGAVNVVEAEIQDRCRAA